MTPTAAAPSPPAERADAGVASVARGGALNLVGSVVYGAANFVLLVVLNRVLGTEAAGIVLVAIAIFNISETVAELGCGTGLVRMLSRHRAVDEVERLRATVWVGVAPVALAGTAAAVALFLLAEPLARLLADDGQVDVVADVLRAMAPFLPFASLHYVVVGGTRGFDTMVPQTAIERIGRALVLPLVVAVAVALGMGPVGVGAMWAATTIGGLALSARAMWVRVRRAERSAGVEPIPADRAIAREFWAFTAPRAVGQSAEVAVSWIDTVLVGILVSTTAAGIYASGTRYILPGTYAAQALMQVTGPRISGLLARDERTEASALLKVVSGWQVAVMWPMYVVIALFPSPLLRVFGEDVVAARGALVAIAVAMLVTAPAGPVASVILMAGRSRQAMFNTLVLVGINVGGNLLLVPRHGITAAGVTWGATIVVAALLPGWQAHRSLGVSTLGRPAFLAAALAAGTVGAVGVAARLWWGDAASGLLVTSSLGVLAYVGALAWARSHLHLDALWNGIRRRS
ncbi:MAG: oligosaccharide flippase family protein [Acidimicrobiales bacterium]|nr:oligosaccharide flippase family protein [Acidimicrobiales bacterium]HRW37404.1 oligosaccharide flippase family protein [Aquihabitans sp.]